MLMFRKDITLLYHSVGRMDPNDDPYRINILPEDFERHLRVISKYKGKISIAFDDGYGNNFDIAFPLLKKYNLDATFFLVTDFMDGKFGSENLGGKNFKERPLTWDEVKIMDKAAMRFGSHSKTHRLLTCIRGEEVNNELLGSRERIEEILGHRIDSFAYPFGGRDSFNDRIKTSVKEARYDHAYTNIMGSNASNPNDNFALRRVRIYREDGPLKLRMKINGAYDWIDTLRLNHATIFKYNQRETQSE